MIEDNGLVEVLRSPELLVPSEEMKCKVGQRHRPIWVSLRVEIANEDNDPVEDLRTPELVVPGEETDCKIVQRR